MRAVDFSLHYPTDPAGVAAMLADKDFQATAARAASARLSEFDTRTLAGGETVVTVVRVVPADRFPDVVRTIVGPELTVRQTETFAAPSPSGASSANCRVTARIGITVDNAPVAVTGSEVFTQAAGDPGATEHHLQLEVSSSVPFFGAKVEQAAAPVITDALRMQETVARDWLAERR